MKAIRVRGRAVPSSALCLMQVGIMVALSACRRQIPGAAVIGPQQVVSAGVVVEASEVYEASTGGTMMWQRVPVSEYLNRLTVAKRLGLSGGEWVARLEMSQSQFVLRIRSESEAEVRYSGYVGRRGDEYVFKSAHGDVFEGRRQGGVIVLEELPNLDKSVSLIQGTGFVLSLRLPARGAR